MFKDFDQFKDFDKFKSSVTQSVAAAADVVQKLNELDEMAEEDEYLKTDDLNVKGSKRKEKWVEDDFMEDGAMEAGNTGGSGGSRGAVSAGGMTPALAARIPAPASGETPTLDSIFGGQTELSALSTTSELSASAVAPQPVISPEERAQQLIAESLFQTPMSSMGVSRASSGRNSPVHSSSFIDYDSAKEDEEEEYENNNEAKNDTNGESEPNNAENDAERENAVMDYLSKNSAGEGFSLLDKVMSSPAAVPPTKKKPSTTLADLDSALGNNNLAAADTNEKPKQANTSYVLSAVAALMNGSNDQNNSSPARQQQQLHPSNVDIGDATQQAQSVALSEAKEARAASSCPDTKNITGLEYDSDSSSDESDWGSGARERDPILSLMEKERQMTEAPVRSGSAGGMISNVEPKNEMISSAHDMGGGGGSLYDGQHGIQKKDPNRFFNDIDRRTAAYDEERGGGRVPQELMDGIPSKNMKQESFGEATSKFQWISQVATGKIIESVSKLESALSPKGRNNAGAMASRKQPADNAGAQGGGMTEDEYSTVVSTSLLAAEEHAELERLKQSTKQNMVAKLIDLAQHHPRESFIVFTLLLLYFVSHWSRKRTEDDVTR